MHVVTLIPEIKQMKQHYRNVLLVNNLHS